MHVRLFSLTAVLALVCGAVFSSNAAEPDLTADKPWGAWKPDQFQVYCGTPAFKAPRAHFDSDEDYEGRFFFEYKYNYNTAIKEGDKDPDYPNPNQQCLKTNFASHAELKAEIEKTLHEALVYVLAMRSPLGRKFADPAHNRLGPVVIDDRHGYAVRIFADPTFNGIMQTYNRMWETNGPYDNRALSIVSLNPGKLNSRKFMRRWGLMHEFIHMIQSKQESGLAWNEEQDTVPAHVKKTVRSPAARQWINEGTADAISRAFVHKTMGKQKPYLHAYRAGARNYYGLRRFDRGLTWLPKGERDGHGNTRVPGYATSSFWQYVAERYYGGDYGYIIDMYRTTKDVNQPDDWLKWVDDFLSRPRGSGGIDESLYSVFPEFMANYVMWGDKKFKERIGEEDWLKEVFWNDGKASTTKPAGCEPLTLQKNETKSFPMNMESLSAQCFNVKIADLPEGYTPVVHFVVEWTAKQSDKNFLLNDLHLSASRFAFHGGGTEDCYESQKAEKVPGSHLCLLPTMHGIKAKHGSQVGGQGKNGKPKVLARPVAGKTFYQTWGTKPTRGNSESLYVLTHSPLNPTDAKHDVQMNSKHHEFVLKIGVSEATAKTNLSKGSKKKGSVDPGGKGLNPAQLPIQGATPRPPAPMPANMPAMEPAGNYFMSSDMCAEGICAVSLQDFDNNPMQFLMPIGSDHVTLIFDDPIKFGSKGVFKTEDLSVAVRVGKGLKTEREGKGQVTIYRFDDEMLHLKASGKYCLWDHVDEMSPSGHPLAGLPSHMKVHEQEEKNECSDWRTFSGELVHPFGWMFNPNSRFTTVETRGTQAYRKLYKQKAMLQQEFLKQNSRPRPDMQKDAQTPDGDGGVLPEEHDPCRLVTKQEVEAAIGAPVVKVKQMMTFCFFDAKRAGAVQIADMDNPLNENAEQTVARLKAEGKDVEVVQGYGDSAYRFGSSMFGGEQLIAYKGDRQIIVTTMSFGQPPEKTQRILDTLMRKALSRM